MTTTIVPRAGGILIGASVVFILFWRVNQVIGVVFPLDVAAILIVGVLAIGVWVGGLAYFSILGEMPSATTEDHHE